MAYPTQDLNHSTEALALFTDHFRNKQNITNLMKSYMVPVQELENVIWDIINKFLLANVPTGDQLDKIGSIVGASRDGLSDRDYFNKVVLQIRVNRSQGLSEDIIQVATLAMQFANVVGLPIYVDQPPAAFLVEVLDYPSPNTLAELLSLVRSVAVDGHFSYSTWPNGNNFKFSSRYKDVHEGAWGSRWTGAVGSLLLAGAQL